VRGVLIGFFLLPVLVIAVLSIRPGGLRQQLRNMRRRLKLALALGGAYVAASTVTKLLFADRPAAEWALVGLAVVLGVIFLIAGQDPEPITPPAGAASPKPRPPAGS
jgi:hypothetical protein